MQFSPSRCCKIILATAVLHSMCIIDNTPLPETVEPFEGDDDDHQEICHEPPSTSSGVTVRQKLICDVFSLDRVKSIKSLLGEKGNSIIVVTCEKCCLNYHHRSFHFPYKK